MLNCIQMLDSPPCLIGWETHDEGDMDTNADTSSWSGTGQITWVSTEEAARLANNNATDFTPETFDDIYEKVWNDQHALQQPTSTEGESTNSEGEEEEELTAADTILETNESSGDDMDSVATEEGSESDTEEDDESSASNGRRLFVAVTSMLSTLLGSSV